MARGNQRGSKNNNPEGRNQYSGLSGAFRSHPIASAAAAGGAVAAGMFLWSKRDKIGEQMSSVGEKASEWSDKMRSGSSSHDGGMASSSSSMGAGSGKRASETGSESIGNPSMAASPTGSAIGTSRATGGRSGSAQSGQNMNPSRTAGETIA